MSERTVEFRLRAAVESSPSGLLMIDADGRIVLVNREIERLFDYSREEILGKPVEILIPERFRDLLRAYIMGFAKEPRVIAMGAGGELYGLRKSGTEVPIEIGLTPIATEEGLFVISSIVDISARKSAEDRFRAAVESSPNGMVMVDQKGRIILVNREVERLFGYQRDELLGQTLEILVPERFRAKHPGYRHDFHTDPQTRAMGHGRDLFGLHKDGSEIPVEIGLNPIKTEEGLFVLASIVDISARKRAEGERRQLEEQLRQAQKMEAVGRLAGGIAHDFNNILGAIVGYTELAREAAADRDVAADLDQVLVASQRGKELVERILRFSRRKEMAPQPMDLAQAVGDAVRLLRATIPASIELKLDSPQGLPRVVADGTSIHQVVMNLATNAAHAMPQGGVLNIGIQPFYARDSFVRAHPGLREGHYLMLSVADTGHGMDEKTREHAFEPFFTTKPPGSGSGLGLAMVHGIMRDHGGTVWLETAPNEGTTVRCLLPSLESADVQSAVSAPEIPRGHGERILFVDDEPDLIAVAQRRLDRIGYATTSVDGPVQALELFRSAPEAFDLVVTDFSMPVMNGMDLAREITRLRPNFPIVLVTGYMEDFPAETLRAVGIRWVLNKPVTTATLAQTVYAALQSTKA